LGGRSISTSGFQLGRFEIFEGYPIWSRKLVVFEPQVAKNFKMSKFCAQYLSQLRSERRNASTYAGYNTWPNWP